MATSSGHTEQQLGQEQKEELSYEEVRRKTRPKNAYEGMTSGLATAAAGMAAGVAGLVVAPMMGAKQDGAAGFAKGMVAGVAGAVVLPVTGLVGGAVQMGRGLANQSEATEAKRKGKVWNKETREWEDPPGDAIAVYDKEANDQRTQMRGEKPNIDYYELLEVTRDADVTTIKKQYYLLARKYHPDKNKDSAEATEKFQQLGEAYQVLSNAELRAKYDKHGVQGLDVDFVDAGAMFGMLFGSELFEPLVGEFLIATAAGRGRELSESEMNQIQEVRIAKLVAELKKRLAPFVAGERDAFTEVQTINAEQLAKASFGEVMLHTLGTVYESEADIALGNVFEIGWEKMKRAHKNIRSQFAAAKAAVSLAQHQARLEAADAALEKQSELLKELQQKAAAGDEEAKLQLYGVALSRAEMERKAMGLALQAMWAGNVVDIQRTLHTVCKRLLREPGLPKEELKRRAEGLAALGHIFQKAQAPPELRHNTDAQMEEALKKLQELYTGGPAEDEEDAHKQQQART